MTRLRVAIRVPVGRPLPEIASFAARCEDAGFDGVGVHDHPSSGRDAYLALALAAQATKRLRLFPATSSPVVRHPLVLAALANSLEEIAPNRICLTVAPGFISTRSVGRNRSGNPPVYLLAAGPRMIELAGEVADGAFIMAGLHPNSIRAARHHLEVGARRGGRSLADFPVVFVVTIGLGPDQDAGKRWVRSWFQPGQPFLAYPSVANLRWLRAAGFDLDDAHDPLGIPEDHAHRIADAFGLFGSPERCADRLLQAREEAGIEDVFLFPAHDLAGGYVMPEAEVDAFERIIRPRLGE
jgi:5,10-methylenetetrahydromethanopterin reductase